MSKYTYHIYTHVTFVWNADSIFAASISVYPVSRTHQTNLYFIAKKSTIYYDSDSLPVSVNCSQDTKQHQTQQERVSMRGKQHGAVSLKNHTNTNYFSYDELYLITFCAIIEKLNCGVSFNTTFLQVKERFMHSNMQIFCHIKIWLASKCVLLHLNANASTGISFYKTNSRSYSNVLVSHWNENVLASVYALTAEFTNPTTPLWNFSLTRAEAHNYTQKFQLHPRCRNFGR